MFKALMVALAMAGAVSAADIGSPVPVPKAKQAGCPCGAFGTCPDENCPAFGGEGPCVCVTGQSPKVAMPEEKRDRNRYDPYRAHSYKDLYRLCKNGAEVWLAVGIPDPYPGLGIYVTHYAVASGFGGLKDGLYRGFPSAVTGLPELTLQEYRDDPIVVPAPVKVAPATPVQSFVPVQSITRPSSGCYTDQYGRTVCPYRNK